MVSEKQYYICDYCGTQYKNPHDAYECEDQGILLPPRDVLGAVYKQYHEQSELTSYVLMMEHIQKQFETYPGHFPLYHSIYFHTDELRNDTNYDSDLSVGPQEFNPGILEQVTLEEFDILEELFEDHPDLYSDDFVEYRMEHENRNGLIRGRISPIYSPLNKAATSLSAAIEREDYEHAAILRDKIKQLQKETVINLIWPQK